MTKFTNLEQLENIGGEVNFIPTGNNAGDAEIFNIDLAGEIIGWIETTREEINEWHQ